MTLRQGQIWTLTTRLTGEVRHAVVVDSDLMADVRRRLMVAPVRPAREVPSALQLLTAATPNGDVVAVYDLMEAPKTQFTDHIGDLSPESLEQVKVALRARFDL